MSAHEIETHIQDLFDGHLDADGVAALERELRNSTEAQEIYHHHARFNAVMALRAEDAGLPGAGIVPIDVLISQQRRKVLRFTAIGTAAAALVAVIATMSIILPDAPTARLRVSPQTTYSLVHAQSENDPAPEGMVVEVGSRLRVDRGTAELSFASGVKGVLRGPADLTLRDEGIIDLHSGILWVEVPPAAVGFQVDTSDFLLTDLGTEFGIVSRQSAADEVHVFTGSVEVRHHRGTHTEIPVSAGQARSARPSGDWVEIGLSPATFYRELPSTAPAPPYLHWSFDREGDPMAVGGTHPAASAIASDRGLPDEGPRAIVGRLGGALSFDETRDYIQTDWPGIGGADARAVALWVRLPLPDKAPDYNSTLLAWGDPSLFGANRGWAVRVTSRDNEFSEQMRDALADRTVLQLRFGETWINGSTDLADGRWHHIAITFESTGGPLLSGVQFYVDGRPDRIHLNDAPTQPEVDTAVGGPQDIPLQIGRSRTREDASCNADLDELYIFEGRLGIDTIRPLANPRYRWRP